MGVAVRPGGVEGHVGGFDVVRVCPVAYAGIGLGRKVRAEVEHDRDADARRMKRAQVSREGQVPAASLVGLDVSQSRSLAGSQAANVPPSRDGPACFWIGSRGCRWVDSDFGTDYRLEEGNLRRYSKQIGPESS